MIYSVDENFIKINETTGTIQNSSFIFDVEISHKAETDSGILLRPLNKYTFTDQTIYLRCIGGKADVRVVPFLVDSAFSSAGDSDTNFESFDDKDVDDIFNP